MAERQIWTNNDKQRTIKFNAGGKFRSSWSWIVSVTYSDARLESAKCQNVIDAKEIKKGTYV